MTGSPYRKAPIRKNDPDLEWATWWSCDRCDEPVNRFKDPTQFGPHENERHRITRHWKCRV